MRTHCSTRGYQVHIRDIGLGRVGPDSGLFKNSNTDWNLNR